MYRFPIGVMVDSFRTDFVTAVTKASQLGAEGLRTGEHDNCKNRGGTEYCEVAGVKVFRHLRGFRPWIW